jgi:hypothetical protein
MKAVKYTIVYNSPIEKRQIDVFIYPGGMLAHCSIANSVSVRLLGSSFHIIETNKLSAA